MKSFIIKGDIGYSSAGRALNLHANSYLVVEYGECRGVFDAIPAAFRGLEILDYTGKLVMPGLVDLHLHAPQYPVRALGMDMELLEWLNKHAFPQEAMYENLEYADQAYAIFAESMKKSFTTRACVFGTVHAEATALLAQKLEDSGLVTFVGKVNMDRNCPDALQETDAIGETKRFLALCEGFENTKPILTPRFIPSCSDKLCSALGELAISEALPVQSHVSENLGEIEWVRALHPHSPSYGHVYDKFSLFGQTPTVMAHCVHSSDEEIALIKQRGVFIAHCPQSNVNLASGIAPARRYLDMGLNMGLGTDVAGGSSEDMLRAAVDAVMVSKLRWRLVDESLRPLSFEDAFYLATLGGGTFFGRVGSFEDGFEADAIVLSDDAFSSPMELSLRERLERIFYLGSKNCISAKFVRGERIF